MRSESDDSDFDPGNNASDQEDNNNERNETLPDIDEDDPKIIRRKRKIDSIWEELKSSTEIEIPQNNKSKNKKTTKSNKRARREENFLAGIFGSSTAREIINLPSSKKPRDNVQANTNSNRRNELQNHLEKQVVSKTVKYAGKEIT